MKNAWITQIRSSVPPSYLTNQIKHKLFLFFSSSPSNCIAWLHLNGQLPWIAPARHRNISAYFGLMRCCMYFGRNLHQPHEGAAASSIVVESSSPSDDDGFIEILWSKISGAPSPASPIVVDAVVGSDDVDELAAATGDGDFFVASCLSASLTPTTSVFLFIVRSITFWTVLSFFLTQFTFQFVLHKFSLDASVFLVQWNISILIHNMLIAMIIWIIYKLLFSRALVPSLWQTKRNSHSNNSLTRERHTTRNRRLIRLLISRLHHLFSSTHDTRLDSSEILICKLYKLIYISLLL